MKTVGLALVGLIVGIAGTTIDNQVLRFVVSTLGLCIVAVAVLRMLGLGYRRER